MKCEELSNDVLLDLANRETDEALSRSLTDHLAECLSCGERYLEVKQIHETTRIALQASPTPDLDRRVIDATGKVLALKARHARRKRTAVAVAAVLAAAALAAAAVLALRVL